MRLFFLVVDKDDKDSGMVDLRAQWCEACGRAQASLCTLIGINRNQRGAHRMRIDYTHNFSSRVRSGQFVTLSANLGIFGM